jgi:regulator of cell morphogenesis and NO signaling
MEIPIQRMTAEHEDAEELLRVIRSLTSAFQPPVAPPGFHALYQGLEEFERDFHRHIHLENNILFSPAIEMPGTDQENANVR